MAQHKNPQQPTYDPHGYQPIIVDEDCLSDEDCRQAVINCVARPRNWHDYLTPEEQTKLEKALEEAEKNKSPYLYSPGELPEKKLRRTEAGRVGMFRAYARDKYANGRRIWYGDGVPFWLRDG